MRHSFACLLLLAGCGAAGTAAAQGALPAALSDREFEALIVGFSESSGFFADENHVSNELGLQRLLPSLAERFRPAGVYLGVGPEQNFSYIAALDPALAFIVDIRRQNLLLHLVYKALFEQNDNRADFMAQLFSRPRPAGLDANSTSDALFQAYRGLEPEQALFETGIESVVTTLADRHGLTLDREDRATIARLLRVFFENGPDIAYIYQGTDEWHPNYPQLMNLTDAAGTNWSYLGSERNWQHVRQMQLKNLIVPVVGDFAGPKALRAIGDYVRQQGGEIDVFYVSNVEPYLFAEDLWRPFYENVRRLPVSANSVFVRTFFGSTARQCAGLDPVIRAPVQGEIVSLLADFERGAIDTQCALVERSR